MPLESHKLATSSFAESEAEGDLEEYEDGICCIKIVQKPGFVCSLNASARLPMPFEKAWEVLCHPDNAAIFRHIDECIYRHVLVNEYPLMSFEVIHEASYKFLLFRGNFRTRLHVDEDHAQHESSFRLLKMQGLFKEFQGVIDSIMSIHLLVYYFSVSVNLNNIFSTTMTTTAILIPAYPLKTCMFRHFGYHRTVRFYSLVFLNDIYELVLCRQMACSRRYQGIRKSLYFET